MASRSSETKKPTSDQMHEAKRRPCLMCGQGFVSHHKGERVCATCKTTAAWREGAGAF